MDTYAEQETPRGTPASNLNARADEQAVRDAVQDDKTTRLEEWVRRKEIVTLRIAMFGTLVAIASLLVSYRQCAVMNQQLVDSRGAAIDAQRDADAMLRNAATQAVALQDSVSANRSLVAVNEKVADAAKANAESSARIARINENSVAATGRSNRLDQRAWVGVIGISGAPTPNETLKLLLAIQNFGRTPAVDMTTDLRVEFAPFGTYPDFEARGSRRPVSPGNAILSPNTVYVVNGSIRNSASEITSLSERQVDASRTARCSSMRMDESITAISSVRGIGFHTVTCGRPSSRCISCVIDTTRLMRVHPVRWAISFLRSCQRSRSAQRSFAKLRRG